MSNSLFSKEMQDQLKELKGQLSKGRDTNSPEGENEKPTEPVSLLTQKQVKKTVKQLDSEHIDDDKVLFMQAMHGVNQLKDKNVRTPANASKAGKPDALQRYQNALPLKGVRPVIWAQVYQICRRY